MRINNVLQVLRQHLADYDNLSDTIVKVGNIGENSTLVNPGEIILTLIKISEENTLRNGPYAKVNQNFKTVYKNRPIFTNLFVLFSCNHSDYDLSLTMISQVVEFFQGQSVFTHLDGHNGIVNGNGNSKEKFKLTVELQNISFEQTNYIWSFLGGKQLPSVVYKIRMIPMEAVDKQTGEGEPILEININGNANF